jgi:hypothetical protein
MLQPYSFYPSERPVQQKTCCGLPMFLSRIEPDDQPDHDKRTFECTRCGCSDTVIVKFR